MLIRKVLDCLVVGCFWKRFLAIFVSVVVFTICYMKTSVFAVSTIIPNSYLKEYEQNGIVFYDPCKNASGSDDSEYGDGTSYKINPDTPPGSANTEGTGGFWYLENRWSVYPRTKISTNNGGIVESDTKIDSDFFDMPYIYAENYDFTYVPWPTTMVRNGNNSTRKYYWIVLPSGAYSQNMGDMYVAYFEKRKEPVFFITYDVWACEHHYLRGMHYCDWAREDPNSVHGGLANNSLGHFSERGSDANNQLGDALGKLTCLHRITTEGETLARESGSCSGSINVDSSSANEEEVDEKEEKSTEKKDKEATDEKTKVASSDTKLHKPDNEWLDGAGLEGFKVLKALNSAAPYGSIDTAAMVSGSDSYASYASDAGGGVGLPGFIVLHWTASGGVSGDYHWSIFGDGKKKIYPPHFAIDVVQKKIWQYFPLSSPSGAVKEWDPYGVQIEVVGQPNNSSGSEYNIYNFTEDQYDYLAKLLIAISNETGIPLESSLDWRTGEGSDIAPKLSAEETKKYIGVLGHEHLPDQDGKWDPGKMWDYLVLALERLGYKYSSRGGSSSDGDRVCPGLSNKDDGCGGEKIANVAREVAWSDDNHHNDIKTEFANAAREVNMSSAATNWDAYAGGAADCGHFVAVAVRKAVDMYFPEGGTPNMESYAHNSSLWKEIPNIGNESNLEPGDVFIANSGSGGFGSDKYPSEGFDGGGHIYIYLGDGEQASASLNHRTGRVAQGVEYATSYTTYRIFRYVGDDCGGESSIGSFDDDLKKVEKSGTKVGVAVTAPGNKDTSEVQIGGSWRGGRAWSTIKVPLAIAAIQENASTGEVTDPYGGTCTHDLDSAVKAAITKSDNCAAWWLWVALGGDDSSAATKVSKVIKAGGDASTSVTSRGDGGSLTSGMTSWSLVGQAIFAANMASIKNSGSVLSNMKKHNALDGSSGLNAYTAMTKGGWGSEYDSATRQFGMIKLKSGKCSAVAIGTNTGSDFSMLDEIVKVLLNHEDDLPSGKCPKDF